MIPLPDKKLPLERVWQHRNAIWGRAYQEYRSHLQWFSTDEEMKEIISRNSNFDLDDPWIEQIENYVKDRTDAVYIRTDEIFRELQIPPDKQNQYNSSRINEIMESMGWGKGRRRPYPGADPIRGYWNPVPPVTGKK